ncbi:MAG: 4Fe-4S binding protein [Clostridia bacterium]|nr:4Fe-4S binding protein [Clostridia bacterium]
MEKYKHSVSLDISKCKGCTSCLRRCPTEAIRIRDGHAQINASRCIDCGECIKVCTHHAKKATCDSLEDMRSFKHTVALPAPALFGQFNNLTSADYVIDGLYRLGFDDVFEVSSAAEMVSSYTRMYLKNEKLQKPLISSACPTIIRMIEINFPYLRDHVLPLLPPVEVAAYLARKRVLEEHPELKSEDVGIFFISPCSAKVSYVTNGLAGKRNNIDRVVSISDLYFRLLDVMDPDSPPEHAFKSGMVGLGWAITGGESSAIFNDSYLAADGIENCIRVLEHLDNEEFEDVEFIELNACSGGCVGGSMTVANPYIAQARLQKLKRYLPVSPNSQYVDRIPEEFYVDPDVQYAIAEPLSPDRGEAMRMMNDIEKYAKSLPGIDCGSCGAPTCMAFAEDIVKNEMSIDDCTIIMRELFHDALDSRKAENARETKEGESRESE